MKSRGILLSKSVAKIVDIELSEPAENEVIIETKACGICMGDVYTFQGKLPGGRVMGHEGVGMVSAVGTDVKNVRVGDRVTALGGPAFAEFFKSNYRSVAKVPEGVEDLALWISEPAACVVNGIRGSGIQIGDNVCVIGVGYMGLLLIQAMPRTIINNLVAIDIREERLNLARRFGAEWTINSEKADAVKEVRGILGSEADVVIEASGAPETLHLATDLVRSGGKLVIFGRHVLDEKVPTEKWHVNGLTVINTAPSSSADFNKDFHDAVKLLGKGVFDQRLLITHRFSYADAEEAFKTASEKPAGYIKGVITF